MDTDTTTIPTSARGLDPRETARQIGPMTILSISGGRVGVNEARGALVLPVSNGYRVEVTVAANDTYNVARIFTRSGVEYVKGVREGVYCDEISDAAYYASCFRSYDATEWVTK